MYYTSIEDLNLFYEVGDAPFGLYWVSPEPRCSMSHSGPDPTGASQTQRFPFKFPIPGSPANATLDYSVYLPISFSPGFDIHNRLPYAEHYNFSIQRELSESTVLTLAYVGTQGHRLISQYAANPGNAALCMQLNQLGATPTCGRTASKPLTRCRTEAKFRNPRPTWPSVRFREQLYGERRELELQFFSGLSRTEGLRRDIPCRLYLLERHR